MVYFLFFKWKNKDIYIECQCCTLYSMDCSPLALFCNVGCATHNTSHSVGLTPPGFEPARFGFPDFPKTGDGRSTQSAIPSRYITPTRACCKLITAYTTHRPRREPGDPAGEVPGTAAVKPGGRHPTLPTILPRHTSLFSHPFYPVPPLSSQAGHTGRVDRARASPAGDRKFGSWMSKTTDLLD